jgi:hypothetical protein
MPNAPSIIRLKVPNETARRNILFMLLIHVWIPFPSAVHFVCLNS